MSIYLPIAELSANIFVFFAMGGAVGFLSGMFGVGGGFLMTPLLIFSNIPPAVAVATGTNQIVASSISGTLGAFAARHDRLQAGHRAAGRAASSAPGIGVAIFTLAAQHRPARPRHLHASTSCSSAPSAR